MKYVIDGKNIKNEADFHAWIKNTFDLPYYGCNLNALRDALTGMISGPIEIAWVNSAISKKNLQDYDKIVDVLNEVAEQDRATERKDALTVKYE